MDLSIIILSHKSQADLARLLPGVFASTKKYSFEVIIVDNDSRDGTAESVESLLPSLPNLRLIRNINNGFAAGNNLGIRGAADRYILLLNPDTQVEHETFEVMLDMMETHPAIGIAGCKVIRPDGSLDLACRRRFPNPWNSFKRLFLLDRRDYNYADVDENREMEVDSVMGAFMLIRKSLMDKIGPLDENFFMYGEDLDYCWRAKEAGFKVWYYPKTFITHFKGSSSAKSPFLALKWFHEAMWIFYKKHYAEKYPFILNWLVFIGVYLRLGVLTAVNLFKSNPRVSK